MSNKPRILFYDIETSPLQAWIWRCGDQVVRHNQLVKPYSRYGIICLSYCWNDGKGAKVIDWGYEKQDSGKVYKKFMKQVEKADVVIGKNNFRFDDKQINSIAFWNDFGGNPTWTLKCDDLESHMRRRLYLPSYALDYVSSELGLGGKVKMEFQDWIDIVTKADKTKFNKMLKYNKKDVLDTRAIWNYSFKHFVPKHNAATMDGLRVCTSCGSSNIKLNGKQSQGKTVYQQYYCKDHRGYAGSVPFKPDGTLSKSKIGTPR